MDSRLAEPMRAFSFAEARPIVVCEIVQFGGAERSLLALSRWLYSCGMAHYFVTYVDHCGLAQYAGHPVTICELRPGIGAWRKIVALRRHFLARGTSRFKPLLSGYQPAVHGTLAGLRGFHNLMHDTPALFSDAAARGWVARGRVAVSNRVAGWGLRSGGTTIVTSEFLKGECRREFGVDAKIARMGGLGGSRALRLRRVVGGLRMLSVCRVEANKRVDWVLRALATLEAQALPLSQRVEWSLDVVGDGSLIGSLQEMAAALGIRGRVRFHGFVADAALEEMYDAAHLFVMPAVQGYGIPAVEALERGIPVLLHRESGVSDLLLETEWATVISGDEAGMQDGLHEAMEKVVAGRHFSAPLPVLPTEDEWAERVAGLCEWG
jgi:glycosyltransferase involved in cell wall biosynthesis